VPTLRVKPAEEQATQGRMDERLTHDHMLGGRILLAQPDSGLRAAIDPVLLAAAVPARPGARVLDLGTGSGVAALCLARRVAALRIAGLELQADLAALARRNAALNGLAMDVVRGDVAAVPFAARVFDHVMANPPFLPARMGTLPPSRGKRLAVGEGEAGLARWVEAALALVKPRGSVTFIHRADRLAELLSALGRGAGAIVVFPLWPRLGEPAKRVLAQARRGVAAPLRLAAGLVLHEADGRYTEAAESVLRDAAALTL